MEINQGLKEPVHPLYERAITIIDEYFNDVLNEQNLLNEINRLKIELNKYKIENENLKNNLAKTNKINESLQRNQLSYYIYQTIIQNLQNENINLKSQLNLKTNEINQLKLKIQNNIKED